MKPFVYKQIFAREEKDWWFLGRQKIVMGIVDQLYPNRRDLKILDVGCGGGGLLDRLSNYGKAVGVDVNRGVVNFNKKKGRNVFWGDANKLEFNSGSFDLVTLLEVLEHLDNDLCALQEASRVLKKRGKLLVTIPAYSFLWGSHDLAASHKRRYSKKEIEFKVCKAGLKIIKVSYLNTFLFPVVFGMRYLKRFRRAKTLETDFQDYPTIINRFLGLLFGFEWFFIKRINLPFGVSILIVAEKK